MHEVDFKCDSMKRMQNHTFPIEMKTLVRHFCHDLNRTSSLWKNQINTWENKADTVIKILVKSK